ncbi:MAG TPA: O-antigen ligase family protein [Geminicoccaceae bacterium]
MLTAIERPAARPYLLGHVVAVLVLLHAGDVLSFGQRLLFGHTPLDTPLWLLLYALAGGHLIMRHQANWLTWFAKQQPLIVAVLVIAACSVAWSIQPSLTLLRVIHLLGSTILGVYLGYMLPARVFLSMLSGTLILLTLGGVAAALLVPDLGQQLYQGNLVWSGLQGDKNGFGFQLALATLVLLTRSLSESGGRPRLLVAVAMVATVALLMSDSVTSLLALVAAVCVIGASLLATILGYRATFAAITVAVIATVAAGAAMLLGPEQLFGVVGRSTSFTGREEIWEVALDLMAQRPWLGFGHGAIWFPSADLLDAQNALLGTTWTAYHAHNSFLQVASELGLPAATMAMLLPVAGLARAIRLYGAAPSPFVLLVIGLYCLFLVSSLLEARFFIDRNLHWILFIAVPLSLARTTAASRTGPSVRPHPANVQVDGTSGERHH